MAARISGNHFTLHFGVATGAAAALCAVPLVLGWVCGANAGYLLLVPALATLPFLLSFAWKVARWMQAPVPHHIALTVGQQCGQGCELHSKLGSPHTGLQVAGRVILDALMFRPLFRATPSAPRLGSTLHRYSGRGLWLGALVFHGSLAIILLRHLRLVLSPVPGFVTFLENADSLTELAIPKLHITSLLFVVGLGMLLGRRLAVRRLRYVSLAADYFPLLILILIGVTGLVMRHGTRPDVVALKDFNLALASLRLRPPSEVDPWLLVHVFLVAALVTYFPASKLMHALGALMSPTLNLANDSRAVRHVNVRNPRVETLHYADYEATFRDRMIAAGLPVEDPSPSESDTHGSSKEK